MRTKFEGQLLELRKKIVKMGKMVGKSIEMAMQSLKERDIELGEKVIADDELINNLEHEIEQLCTHLIATQQPFASDLRIIVAAYKLILSIERMGDLAVDIAKVSIRIGKDPIIKPLIDLPKMVDTVTKMIYHSIEAYLNVDIDAARKLAEMDHEVDHHYKKIFIEVIDMMQKDPKVVHQAVQLLLVARYIERIGDYCTNIGEEVIYMELGIREDLNKD